MEGVTGVNRTVYVVWLVFYFLDSVSGVDPRDVIGFKERKKNEQSKRTESQRVI